MRSLALLFALAVPVATASAASTTVDARPLSNVSAKARHAQWVRMSFYNPTMKLQQLQVGRDSFLVQGHQTIALSVAAGSTVHLSSPQDSRINEQIEVTSADANRTVVMH